MGLSPRLGRLRRPVLATGCTAALILSLALLLSAASGPSAQAGATDGTDNKERPNVVVILTDDEELRSFEEMPMVQSLVADQGITFKNSFVSFPLCCPSRATLLTGQYAHNHHVLHNNPPTGSFTRLDSTNTLPLWLQRAGYYTAHVGKYLNYYEQTPELVPPGWDGWWTLTGCSSCRPVDRLQHVYRYYGYRLNENGDLVDYGEEVGDYQTDVLATRVADVIRERAPLDQPFFISFDPVAPHGGLPQPSPHPPFDCTGDQVALPAARHADAFDERSLPRTPSFNEEDVSDKPAAIRDLPRLSPSDYAAMTTRYRCRLQSLLAVDEAVAEIVAALEASGELDNTYLIVTSDNGYFFGEHRIPMEKILLYEEAIRVPLVMRGPGIEAGSTTRDLVVNADLAPTIVQAAGATPGLNLDGRSLLPVARRPNRERGREVLLETIGESGIRNHRYSYVEHDTGERELYDLERDPYQLENRDGDPEYAEVMAILADHLAALRSCAGQDCSREPRLLLRTAARYGCIRRGTTVALRGASLGDVDELEVAVGSRVIARLDASPYTLRVGRTALPVRRPVALTATADLTDGRRWSTTTRIRACRTERRG